MHRILPSVAVLGNLFTRLKLFSIVNAFHLKAKRFMIAKMQSLTFILVIFLRLPLSESNGREIGDWWAMIPLF